MKTLITAAMLFFALTGSALGAQDRFDIAITVDDLPAHAALPPGMTRAGIAEAHVRALRKVHAPRVWGFVNARKLETEPDSAAALSIWRKAGFPLGNHAYSHMNLGRATTPETWEADVIAGEAAVAALMGTQDWHYFRYPNLSAGEGEAKTRALSFLRGRGYRIADVSVAFGDWNYSDAYARCLAKGDTATIEAMKVRYFKEVDAGIVWMKAASQRVYGRMIPQVLLTHAGGWSAVTLPEVLKRLKAAGGRFVTLEAAQSDPAYADPGGGNLMERAAKARGISLSDIPSAASSNEVREYCK
ncbi:MAG: polysaccharide deacetylase family protein [Asticcacaulis sp.]